MEDGNDPKKAPRQRPAPHASPYPVSRLSAPISLVDTAREIERADQMIQATASAQLQVIADQIRSLQEQAAQVLDQAHKDAALHRARCNFTRVVGKVYHLYEASDGELFFSMLSPEDWNGAPPHPHRGSYRLEADQSWTDANDLEAIDAQRAQMRQLVSKRLLP